MGLIARSAWNRGNKVTRLLREASGISLSGTGKWGGGSKAGYYIPYIRDTAYRVALGKTSPKGGIRTEPDSGRQDPKGEASTIKWALLSRGGWLQSHGGAELENL